MEIIKKLTSFHSEAESISSGELYEKVNIFTSASSQFPWHTFFFNAKISHFFRGV